MGGGCGDDDIIRVRQCLGDFVRVPLQAQQQRIQVHIEEKWRQWATLLKADRYPGRRRERLADPDLDAGLRQGGGDCGEEALREAV